MTKKKERKKERKEMKRKEKKRKKELFLSILVTGMVRLKHFAMK